MYTNCGFAECPECGADYDCRNLDCDCFERGYEKGYNDAEQFSNRIEEKFEHQNYLNQKYKEAIDFCFQRAEEYRKSQNEKQQKT